MAERTPTRAVTIKDVAAAANVSRATAARALNGYGYVGEAVAQRVTEAAARLGYRGNRVAQALRRGQMPIIGFIPGDIQNPFFARVAHDIDVQLRSRRYNLIIASSEESQKQERELLDSLCALNLRGLILAREYRKVWGNLAIMEVSDDGFNAGCHPANLARRVPSRNLVWVPHTLRYSP